MAQDARGAAAAIGNFDGVHLGHQAVLAQTESAARRLGAPLAVVTFEPHPRDYFAPDGPPFRLMNAAARAHRLEKLGVELLVELPFDADLAGLEPRAFAERVIVEELGLSHVTVGADFCFGKARAGDVEMLKAFGAEMGFEVAVAEIVETGDSAISSTAIREALTEGRPEEAAAMLGHLHRIEGEVLHGEKRGRELGYPTANQSLEGLLPPRHGVYAVEVEVLTGDHKGSYHGAASIGVRPMFGENAVNCETYLFDFKGDLYGVEISVGLVSFLRPEHKFASVEGLVAQMEKDCALARDILKGG